MAIARLDVVDDGRPVCGNGGTADRVLLCAVFEARRSGERRWQSDYSASSTMILASGTFAVPARQAA